MIGDGRRGAGGQGDARRRARDERTRAQVRRRAAESGRRDGGIDRLGVAEHALVLGAGRQLGQRPDRQLNLFERIKSVVINPCHSVRTTSYGRRK